MKRGLLLLVIGSFALAQNVTLPADIQNYLSWERANPDKITSASAHPAVKDVYYNEVVHEAITDGAFPAQHPSGSVYVKERMDPASLTVTNLYGMRKRDGFNPQGNNWQYGMWKREDGDLKGGWMTVSQASGCAECHARAKEKDYVFLNYLK